MTSLGVFEFTLGADIGKLVSGLSGVTPQVKQTEDSLKQLGSTANKTGEQIKAGMAFGAGLAAVQAGLRMLGDVFGAVKGSVIDFNSQLQSAEAAFTGLLGSASAAGSFLQDLKTFAATTPFEFPDVLRASQRFIGMGMAAENVIPLLKDVGTVVTAMGGGSDAINHVTLALGQMQAKGKVTAQEMNQLAEAGVQGWAILAKALDMPISQVMKLAEQGKISAEIMLDAFHKAASDPKMQSAAENMSRSWQAGLSNMTDGVRMFISAGTKPLFEEATKVVVGLGNWLTTSDDAKRAQIGLANAMTSVISLLRPMAAGAMQVAQAFADWAGAIPIIQKLLGTVAIDDPIAKAAREAEAATKAAAAEATAQKKAALVESLTAITKESAARDAADEKNALAIKANEMAIRGNEQAMRGVKAAEEAVKDGYEAQLKPLEASLKSNEAQERSLKRQAENVETAYTQMAAPLKANLATTEAALRTNKDQARSVTDAYAGQIEPLQKALDLLRGHVDISRQIMDAQERIKDDEIKQAMIDAEGDPVKKTALTLKLAENELEQKGLDLKKGGLDINAQLKALDKERSDAKKNHKDFDEKSYQLQREILLKKREQNELDKAAFGLVDQGKLAKAKADAYALQRSSTGRHLVEDKSDAAQRIEEIPLEARIADLKKEEGARLEVLTKQADALQRQADSYQVALANLGAGRDAALEPIKLQQQALGQLHEDIQAKIGEIKDAETAALEPLLAREKSISNARDGLDDQATRLKDIKTDSEAAAAAEEKKTKEIKAQIAALDAKPEYTSGAGADVPPPELKGFAKDAKDAAESVKDLKTNLADLNVALGDLSRNLAPIATGLAVFAGLRFIAGGLAAVSLALGEGGLAGALGAVGAAMGEGSLLMLGFGALMKFLGPIGWIAVAAGLLQAAWQGNWGDIQGKVKFVSDWFGTDAWPKISGFLRDIQGALYAAWDYWDKGWIGIGKILSDAMLEINKINLFDVGQGLIFGLQKGWEDAMKGMEEWVKNTLIEPLPKWVKDMLGIKSPSTVFADIGKQLVEGLKKGLREHFPGVKEVLAQLMGGLSAGVGGGGDLEGWLRAAIKITGVDDNWLQGLTRLALYESSGDPTNVNPEAVSNGEHAMGLLQTIPSTFATWAIKGLGGIFDPIANAVAAIRYIQHHPNYGGSVYGTPLFIKGYGGYEQGGWVNQTGPALVHQGEFVIPKQPASNLAQSLGAGGRSAAPVSFVFQQPVLANDQFMRWLKKLFAENGLDNGNIFGGIA